MARLRHNTGAERWSAGFGEGTPQQVADQGNKRAERNLGHGSILALTLQEGTDKLESVSNLYMNMFFDRLTTYQIQTPQSWYSKSRSYLQLPWSQSFQSAAEASFPLSLIFHSLSRQIHHRDWGWFLKLLYIVS